MSIAKLTMIGLENWQSAFDKSLFDKMILPEGFERVTVIDNILLRAGEMEVLYPDADFLTDAIGLWSKKHYSTFEKWHKALTIQYNPLENYDRQEEYTDERTGSDSVEIGSVHSEDVIGEQITDNDYGTITNTDTMATQHTVNENTVSAFDSSTYQPSEKNENTLDSHTDTHTQSGRLDTITVEEHTNKSDVDAHTDTTTYGNQLKHTARIHGNIGVTTSQQMLQSELDIATWNLYEHVADLFINEFCIMVY